MPNNNNERLNKLDTIQENLLAIPNKIIPHEDKKEFLNVLEMIREQTQSGSVSEESNKKIEKLVDELNVIYVKLATKEFAFGVNLVTRLMLNVNEKTKKLPSEKAFSEIATDLQHVNDFLPPMLLLCNKLKTLQAELNISEYQNEAKANPQPKHHHHLREKISHFCHSLFSHHHHRPTAKGQDPLELVTRSEVKLR